MIALDARVTVAISRAPLRRDKSDEAICTGASLDLTAGRAALNHWIQPVLRTRPLASGRSSPGKQPHANRQPAHMPGSSASRPQTPVPCFPTSHDNSVYPRRRRIGIDASLSPHKLSAWTRAAMRPTFFVHFRHGLSMPWKSWKQSEKQHVRAAHPTSHEETTGPIGTTLPCVARSCHCASR